MIQATEPVQREAADSDNIDAQHDNGSNDLMQSKMTDGVKLRHSKLIVTERDDKIGNIAASVAILAQATA